MASPGKHMGEALIISPFATYPLDAGHRRRVMQVTRLLAEGGYRITFLLLAFEDPWYWRHDADSFERLRSQWDEVILAYAGQGIGLPPKKGDVHQLDEWWDQGLEQALRNLTSRRHFDVVVVHNVWLSKAFEFFPATTFKILETHDLFWKRPEVFARIGRQPEFYVVAESQELLGIQRADVAVTIQECEGAELVAKVDCQVVTVPFYDPDLERLARPPGHPHYLSTDKVTFGVLATPNPFNIAGLNALLASLEQVIVETFAPVEVVVGGRVGEHVEKRAAVKCVGYVENEAAFYDNVDFAIAPVFDGTGFKVKTADVLALRVPGLFSTHAAEGTAIDPSLLCDTPDAMARRMADIALHRPSLADVQVLIRRARNELRTRTNAGGENLLATVAGGSQPLVIDLSRALPESDVLVLLSYFCSLRTFCQRFPVIVLLDGDVFRLVGKVLPLGANAVIARDWRRLHGWGQVTLIDVFGDADRELLGLGENDLVLADERWRRSLAGSAGKVDVLGMLPLFDSEFDWQPSVLALRRNYGRRHFVPFGPDGLRRRFVYTDEPVGNLGPIETSRGTTTFFIPLGCWDSFQASVIMLLTGGVAEVVWAAAARGVAHRAVLESCALQRIPCFGWLDNAVLGRGPLADSFRHELESASTVIEALWRRLPALRDQPRAIPNAGEVTEEQAAPEQEPLPMATDGQVPAAKTLEEAGIG
jgi:hypothetical protein